MISYDSPESAVKWSDSMSRTRRVRRSRRRLMAATSSAAASMSTASTRARGNAFAAASAMQPEPVPRSSTRVTRARVDPRREPPFDEFGERRARDQHAFVDVERAVRRTTLRE